MDPPRILALKGNKQWVVGGRAVSGIYLLNLEGVIQYQSALPWLPARDLMKRKIDVVGLCNLKSPVSLKSLTCSHRFEPLRPILLPGAPDDVQDERRELYENYFLYLPLTSDQLTYCGVCNLEDGRLHEWVITLPAIAEISGSENPIRFNIEKFTIISSCPQ